VARRPWQCPLAGQCGFSQPVRPRHVDAGIHADVLKPLGFKKQGQRSERSVGQLHQAVACFSSRWNSDENVSFTLEFRATHVAFFRLLQPKVPFSGLTEACGPRVSWRLRHPFAAGAKWWTLVPGDSVEEIRSDIFTALAGLGALWIQRTATLEGLASFCAERQDPDDYRARSWALAFLGRHSEAQHVLVEAAQLASTDDPQRESIVAWRDRLAQHFLNKTPGGARR
jgi:hypothetical protein